MNTSIASRLLEGIKVTLASIIIALPLAFVAVPVAEAADCAGQQTAIDYNCRADKNPIFALFKGILRVLSGVVAAVVIGGIAFGGIMYSSARGNQGQVTKALEIIRNAVIGLLLYIFMIAILNFLIPGGAI